MRWLLRLLVSDQDRRSIDADLAELYDVRRRHDGERAANRWLRRQRRIYPWHLLMDRLQASVPRGNTMQHLWRDLGYSLRSLARVPALSATLVLTIGVGSAPAPRARFCGLGGGGGGGGRPPHGGALPVPCS